MSYACKCLNIRIKPSDQQHSHVVYDPVFEPVFIDQDGISISHPQVTLRTRSRGIPISGSSQCSRYTSLTCLVCQTLVYRVHQIIPLSLEGNEGPQLLTEEWVDREIMKSSSGWIEVHNDCLTVDNITKAQSLPSYSDTFNMVLRLDPPPPTLPVTGSLFRPPSPAFRSSPPSAPAPVPPPPQLFLSGLKPVLPPPAFTSSHPAFLHLSELASERSRKLREEAEQDLAHIVATKRAHVEQAEEIVRCEVEFIWRKFKEGLHTFGNVPNSGQHSGDHNPSTSAIPSSPGPRRSPVAVRHIPASQHSSSSLHNIPTFSSPPPSSSSRLASPFLSQDAHLNHHNHSQSVPVNNSSRSTPLWGDLVVWMDEQYAKQVCGLMGWDPVNVVKVPHLVVQPAGYCCLTFSTPAHAASVLAQIGTKSNQSLTVPNSTKPNWSPSVLAAPPVPSPPSLQQQQQQHHQEYSIFVGDLAPETSNSDLVAVFRNPVLGLRNDRAPKFIRPFLSCKSAKIMLDPLTRVSRGYGFVRFSDEADQQRALIEMHGLYCLSRPMRISPATAKFKPALPHISFHPQSADGSIDPISIAPQSKSVSTPIAKSVSTPIAESVSAPIAAASFSESTVFGGSSIGGSLLIKETTTSSASIASSAASLEGMPHLPHDVLVPIVHQYVSGGTGQSVQNEGISITTQLGHDGQGVAPESSKHHAQARLILGNPIGSNGEQLTSTDPYNTTVFVGGLSLLISEETLRTFFAPFGDIHYVKVPVGKHCGFVQFVRKADAERAIEKMQGFPIGGSRIRLSWGRSQYKAAQADALQAQYQVQLRAQATAAMTPEQAYQVLQKSGITTPLNPNQKVLVAGPGLGINANAITHSNGPSNSAGGLAVGNAPFLAKLLAGPREESSPSLASDFYMSPHFGLPNLCLPTHSIFSSFSPDPNQFGEHTFGISFTRSEHLPHPSCNYAPVFGPLLHGQKCGYTDHQDLNGALASFDLDQNNVARM